MVFAEIYTIKNNKTMNSLYIGLGGAGIEAAVTIFKKQSLVEGNLASNRYLLIDTAFATEKTIPEALRKDFIDIGAKSPNQIKQEMLNSPLKRWFVGWYDWYDHDHPLHEGSGTVRQYGRIGLLGRYDEVYQRLSTVISQSEQALSPTEQLNIFVITGSCGGTGSGIALDVLYMINTIMRSGIIQDIERCNNVYFLMALPEMYLENEKADVQYNFISNAMAFFTELQFVMDNASVIPSPYYPIVPPKEWMQNVPFAPFKRGFAVESSKKTRQQMSQDMANLSCILGDANPILPADTHDLADGVLADKIRLYKNESAGLYSFVDWKFARKVMKMDENSDVRTEEIWERLCKQ